MTADTRAVDAFIALMRDHMNEQLVDGLRKRRVMDNDGRERLDAMVRCADPFFAMLRHAMTGGDTVGAWPPEPCNLRHAQARAEAERLLSRLGAATQE